MSKKSVALLTIHGMGDTPKTYHHLFLERIKKRMGEEWKQVEFASLYYQDILQINQNEIYLRMKPHVSKLWQEVRKFILYGFSDAASLDYQKELNKSLYHRTQTRIAKTLQKIYTKRGNIPVVILAYSLGCHVLSNYIWDSQQLKPDGGVWRWGEFKKLTGDENDFVRLKSLNTFITIGCNIPVFVGGYRYISPFRKPNRKFQWLNLYDKDDVLGWPLEPLSTSYRKLVEDIPINANEGFSDLVLKSWNPFSHENYFGDRQVVKAVGNTLSKFIQ